MARLTKSSTLGTNLVSERCALGVGYQRAEYGYFAPIEPVFGDDYAKALCGAKVCLAFLSKLNRDSYTRRCFEIPACGNVMLAERTADLCRMFKEDEEACFFSSSISRPYNGIILLIIVVLGLISLGVG